MQLYPLKFQPIFKERLWGGTRLQSVLGKRLKGNSIGESWEISTVRDNISIVANGPLKGKSLDQLIEEQPKALLGKKIIQRFGNEFPILIKFIDAEKDLSIQVHPDDEIARKYHDSNGKTEMWYVLDADKDAELLIGFTKEVGREDFIKGLKDNSLPELMHREKVRKGDSFLINAGKIHAIGKGVLLAEIQQTSDVTYRVYDYGRRDRQGNKRELHTKEALRALDFSPAQDSKLIYKKELNAANTIVNSPYFHTSFIKLDRAMDIDLSKRDSFTIYIGLEGEILVKTPSGEIQLQKGETCLLPACMDKVQLKSEFGKLLEVTL